MISLGSHRTHDHHKRLHIYTHSKGTYEPPHKLLQIDGESASNESKRSRIQKELSKNDRSRNDRMWQIICIHVRGSQTKREKTGIEFKCVRWRWCRLQWPQYDFDHTSFHHKCELITRRGVFHFLVGRLLYRVCVCVLF